MRKHRYFQSFLGGNVILLLAFVGFYCSIAAAFAANPYLKRTFWENGKQIDEIVVPGRPPPFPVESISPPQSDPQAGINVLSLVPSFTWCYGCSATSAAMMMGYYDNHGYPNMYAGPANGGVCPLNNNIYWGNGESPLSATHIGIDGRTIRGHVEDYWSPSGSSGPDPYIVNGWPEHTQGDCTGDFMGTNQSKYGNGDGGTTFWFYTDGSPMNDYTGAEPRGRDGCHGMKLFVNSRGYTVISNFTQYIYGYQGNTRGFTFSDFKVEIDAGRPVLIQVQGHTMLGFGYDDSSSTIYIHNTWDNSDHSMTWGSSYSGMQHWGVTVLRLQSPGAAPTITTSSPLPSGTVGEAYTQTLTASGGTTPYTWSLLRGNLPSGLDLNSAGVISGTPDTATNASFTVQVVGNDGSASTVNFTLTISPAPQPTTNVIAGVTVNYSGTYMVGTDGWFNALIITNAGILTSSAGIIGNSAFSSNNYALVTGTSSIWSNSGSLTIGSTGSFNQLTINNGGKVQNGYGYVGNNSNAANNAVLVTDAGSFWSNSSTLYVGYAGSSNSLTIANGARVLDPTGSIGNYGGADNNSALVTGPGSIWSNTGNFYVGNSGSSNGLTIANGGHVFNTTGYLGGNAGASNSVLVAGAGSLWSNSSSLYVGNGGAGNSLAILNGAQLTAGGAVTVGSGTGACANSVLVSNAGYVASVGLTIGSGGGQSNSVFVQSNTVWNLRAGALVWGSGVGAFGNSLNIDGSSALTNISGLTLGENNTTFYMTNSASGVVFNGFTTNQLQFPNGFGALTVGSGGSGTALIVSNYTFKANGLTIGTGVGQSNSVVLMSNSVGNLGGGALVWSSGAGAFGNSLNIDGSSALTNIYGLALGENNTTFYMTNSASGVVLNGFTTNQLQFASGFGALTVGNGGAYGTSLMVSNYVLNAAGLTIGASGGRSNSVTLMSGSLWNLRSSALVWGSGAGAFGNNLNMDASSALTNIVSLTLGDNDTTFYMTNSPGGYVLNGFTTNQLQFSPAGFGALTVGASGSHGTVLVISNYLLRTTASSYVGNNGTNVVVLVAGPGSVWSNSSILYVGYSGFSNNLMIANSGQVFNTDGRIGYNSGANNNAAWVTDPGSVWSNNGSLYVGYSGGINGLTITNGGQVFDTDGRIGWNSTANSNWVLVAEAGSVWNNAATLFVGSNGWGNQLTVSDNGTVLATNAIVGAGGSSSINLLNVSGGNLWVTNNTSGGALDVRRGSLNVNGGSVTADRLYVTNNYISSGNAFNYAFLNLSAGTLTTRAGSAVVIPHGSNLVIGATTGQTATWNILGGLNTVSNIVLSSSENPGDTILGGITGAVGVVNVTGAGTVWSNASELRVGGSSGGNQLIITNGARVFDANGYIGNSAGANSNTVLVSDAGSVWSNYNLYVGYSGSGNQLTIANGAVVSNALAYVGNNASASNNTVLVSGLGSVWNCGRIDSGYYYTTALYVGNAGPDNELIISNGGSVASTTIIVGNQTSSVDNAIVVNGGKLSATVFSSSSLDVRRGSLTLNSGTVTVNQLLATNGGSSIVSFNGGTLNSSGTVISNGSVFAVGGDAGTNAVLNLSGGLNSFYNGLIIGNSGANNQLKISGNTWVATSNCVIGALNGATNDSVLLSSGHLLVSDGAGGGVLDVRRGNLTLNSGTATVDRLLATNGAASVVSFNGGRLETAGSVISNGVKLTVGDGTHSATLNLLGGTHSLANGLMISTNGTLAGAGTLFLGGVTTTNFGTIAVGVLAQVPGGLTHVGNLMEAAGSVLDFGVGRAQGMDCGFLQVQGNVALNGLLEVTLSPYYVDAGGLIGATDVFAVLTATAPLAGNFSNVASGAQLESLDQLGSFQVTYAGSNVMLSGFQPAGELGSFTVTNRFATNGLLVGNLAVNNQLVVTNGGVLNDTLAVLGRTASSSSNTALVTGGGSIWTNAGPLRIGGFGPGNQMTVTSGGRVSSVDGVLGWGAGSSSNAVVVSDSGSAWTNANGLFVGYGGSLNQLTISNGAFAGNRTGYVGYASSASNNAVLVSGSGSLWSNYTFLYVGNAGSFNQLTINNGGRVGGQTGYVGYTSSAKNNAVTVSDAGSVWTNGGYLYVGGSGSGNTLSMTNGGRVFNTYGYIGYDVGASNNVVLVTGSGSMWTNNGYVYIGNGGSSNQLTIASGGQVFDSQGHIGENSSASNNTVLITDAGSAWVNNGYLYVGNGSSGNQLTVADGGQLLNVRGHISESTDASNNVVLVTGAGSVWTNSENLYAGNYGSANGLTVANGGQVFDSQGHIGERSSASNNWVLVTDPGSFWNNNSYLYVGVSGASNSLTVANGGQVFNSSGYLGYNAGAGNNTALVTGVGSIWTNNGTLYAGNSGDGNLLTIADGGQVFNSGGEVGYNAGANSNSVLVSGNGSLWNNSGTLNVGDNGSGNGLTITNGGQVVNLSGCIGTWTGASNNWVVVTGTGSVWNNSGTLEVGSFGSGNSLIIASGGQVVGTSGFVGLSGTNNEVLVTGAGSVWSNSDYVYVGLAGSSNTMMIADGGQVLNGFGYIGYGNSVSNNSVVVTGPGSVWSNSSALSVGDSGFGNSLTIANSGLLLDTYGYVGYDPGANSNTVLVGGTGSVWNNAGDLFVGISGSANQLMITNGAQVFNTNAFIGYAAGANGNAVLVTGAGSIWSNAGPLSIGLGGSGNRVTVAGGGQINATLLNNFSGSVFSVSGGSAFFPHVVNGGTFSFQSGTFNPTSFDNIGLFELWNNLTIGAAAGLTNHDGGDVRLVSNATLNVSGGFVITNATLEFAGVSTNTTPFLPGVTFENASTIKWAGYDGNFGNHAVTGNLNLDLPSGPGLLQGSVDNASLTVGGGSGVLYVGSNNLDSLTITDGGHVLDSIGYIGFNASASNNSARVGGSGSLWSNSSSLFVGYSGSGNSLLLTNGGMIWATNVIIGATNTSTGNVVTVSGGQLYATNSSGGGALNVLYGTLNLNSGTVAVDRLLLTNGVNSVFNFNGGVLQAGQVLSAQPLTVNGGTLTLADSFVNSPGGTLQLNSGGMIVPGSMANQGLFIQNGGLFDPLVFTNSGSFVLNSGTNMDGVFLNLASGTVQQNGGELDVNVATNYGSWAISGGVANLTNFVNEDHGALTVSGGILNGSLTIGNTGSFSQLTITNGGVVVGNGSVIGNSSLSSNNTVIVTGSGSSWSNSGSFFVGDGGSFNNLSISQGGSVLSTADSTIGGGYGIGVHDNMVSVNGAGSVWVNGSLLIGDESAFNNQLTITNGGKVITSDWSMIGYASTTNNSVLVSDPDSVWSVGRVWLGYFGGCVGNSLTISNGGQVLSANCYMGGYDPYPFYLPTTCTNNWVLVSGPGSVWSNSDTIYVGSYGPYNNLTVNNGGGVISSNIIVGNTVGGAASIGNLVTLSGGYIYVTNAAQTGTLDLRAGTLVLNSGTVAVNQLLADNPVNFNGGMLKSGATTVNNGSIFAVGDGIQSATYDMFGGAHSFANGLFIDTNAILTGTGAITGSISDAGLIAPGNGFGVITDIGNLTMLGGGAMTMELGGTNAWLYDQFDLTGALSFGGTLTVSMLNGYTPHAGDQFNLFDFGSSSGAFSATNLPTLSPTLYWNTSLLYSTGVIEADQSTGSVQVILAPQAAIDAGAKWQVDADGNWHTNNETVGGLVVGSHTLSYTNLTGWIAPTNQSVQIVSGVTTTNTGTYQLTPLLLTAVSRKTQGAGTFDLNLNLNGVPSATVEPRLSGPTQLVFTFNKAMAASDGTLDATEFTVTNATFVSASIVSSNLTLNLTSVVDQSKVTVVMNGLTDLAGNPLSGTNAVLVRSLYGDVNQSGTVNAVDLQQVKNNLLAALTPANFLCDVNSSGTINAVDLQQIKNNLLHSASLDTGSGGSTLSTLSDSMTTSGLAMTMLGEALGATNLTWSTDGDALWTPTVAEDGSQAAWSGKVNDLNVSWVETTVTGPGTLSFDWMVSSELNGDCLTFAIDGVNQPGAISGEVGWQTLTFNIPAGTHRLTWTYSKNGATASGLDAGWVRRVVCQ